MNFDDLLHSKSIDPRKVLVLRHRPHEPALKNVLPWLAAERHDLFNAYQQAQGGRLERAMQAMTGTGYIASFIGREAGKSLFVGLYSISASKPLTYEQYWRLPANVELEKHGMRGRKEENKARVGLWFDLVLT